MLKKVKNRSIKLIKALNERRKDVKNVEKTLYKWRYLCLSLLLFAIWCLPLVLIWMFMFTPMGVSYPVILLGACYIVIIDHVYPFAERIDYYMSLVFD